MMTKKALNRLKKSLPKGYRETLAHEFDCSVGHVDSVLSGLRNNISIIKAALELAKAHKLEMEQLTTEIKQL